MTVSSEVSTISYEASGTTGPFTVPFYFLQNSDLTLIIVSADGTETPLTIDTDYTVSGAGVESGGSVDLVQAGDAGSFLYIYRTVDMLQETDYAENDSFPAESHERALDKLTMICQQFFRVLGTGLASTSRALLLGDTDTNGSGAYRANGNRITNLAAPDLDSDAANKLFVLETAAAVATDGDGNPVLQLLARDDSSPGAGRIGYGGTDMAAYIKDDISKAVPSIAALRALDKTLNSKATVLGYYAAGDGGGGVYHLDASDTTSPDNAGTIIVATDGGRWKLAPSAVLSINQFGAKGDGATDDSAAIAAAVAVVGAGGILEGRGNFVLDTDVDAPNCRFTINGTLSGDGAITGDGCTITYVNGYYQDAQTPFGAGFVAHEIDRTTFTTTHGNTISTRAVVRETVGSGENGPSKADVSLLVSSSKKDYLTSDIQGEVDGVFIVVRQGSRGDQAGVLIDHQKVGGVSEGTLAIEASGVTVDSTGTPVRRIQTIFNFLEGAGGFSGGSGYASWAEAQIADVFSAYHANNNVGFFQNFLTFGSSRDPSSLLYSVDGQGRTFARADNDASNPAYSFVGDPNTGMYRIGADAIGFSAGGVISAAISANGVFPGPDNTISLGEVSNRWAQVFAAAGTINTSDARLKTEVSAMTEAEISAAKDLAAEVGTYKFLDAVQKKGEGARLHIGMTVQRAIEIMQSHGLDPTAYGFICYDQWEDEYETVPEVVEWSKAEGRSGKSEKKVITPATQRLVKKGGDLYGFRYDELAMFIARGHEARIAALEAKINP